MASLLLELTGDAPTFRIIDFLIERKGEDFSKTEIAHGAGISRATLFNHWHSLEKNGLVRATRAYGKTRLYTLEARSPIVRRILDLEQALISDAMVRHARAGARRFKKIVAANS